MVLPGLRRWIGGAIFSVGPLLSPPFQWCWYQRGPAAFARNGQRDSTKWSIKVCKYPRIPIKACTCFTYFVLGELVLCLWQNWEQHNSYLTVWLPKTLLQCLDLEYSSDSLPVLSVVGGPVTPARLSVAEASPHRLTLHHQYSEPVSQRSWRKAVTGPEPPSYGIWWGYVNTLEGAVGR